MTLEVILAYLEFLHTNGKTITQIQNALSVLKSRSLFFSLPTDVFNHHKITLYVKSLQKNAPLSVKLKTIIDIPCLKAIAHACDSTYMGQIFKAIYLLYFFSFLRLSNLVPHTKSTFSVLKHLTQDDIFFKENSALMLIKCSKTMQLNKDAKLITIPSLQNDICPVQAIRRVLTLVPKNRLVGR